MSDTCYCDYGEPSDVYCVKTVKAIKPHKCYECHKEIQPGEVYEHVSSLYDGCWTVSKTCPRCLDARNYITAHAPCFCWMHGSLLDDARDTVNQYGQESAGFYIGAMKRVLRAERGPRKATP